MNIIARTSPATLVALTLLAAAAAPPAHAADLQRGAEIFQANCATCHGPGGSPDADSELVKGLGVVPANFSDALFNIREPGSTWKVVIT